MAFKFFAFIRFFYFYFYILLCNVVLGFPAGMVRRTFWRSSLFNVVWYVIIKSPLSKSEDLLSGLSPSASDKRPFLKGHCHAKFAVFRSKLDENLN